MFEYVKNITRGGFGRVDLVKLASGELAAKKTFDPPPTMDEGAKLKHLARFGREVKIQEQLSTKYPQSFVPILHKELTGPAPWFVMPLATRNYAQQIDEDRREKKITEKALADILVALELLHAQGIVHRDLKPQNVLLIGESWRLSDFGLVKPPSTETTSLTSTDSAWGSESYAAPEQAQDFHEVTAAADIYSFGCILHDLVDGSRRLPFRTHTSRHSLGLIIEKCTDENPTSRFPLITGLRNALFTALAKPRAGSSSVTDSEWVTELAKTTEWTQSKFEEFISYFRGLRKSSESFPQAIWAALDEAALIRLHQLNVSQWRELATGLCKWANDTEFGYEYCDVVIGRLEAVYNLGDHNHKATAAIAAAALATRHNRWFVMRSVIKMCGPGIDEGLADRIALEISIDYKVSLNFFRCVGGVNKHAGVFHPRIAEAFPQQGLPL